MQFNKMPLIAGAVLILVVGVGALVCSGSKKKSAGAPTPPVSARAVVVPASPSRTIVVPPCNTPVSATTTNAAAGRPTPGATTVSLPPGPGTRTLLVPNCQLTKTGSTNAEGTIPSAVFVLGSSDRITKDREGRIQSDGVIAESQLLLTDGSDATTIVVPPCTKKPVDQGRDSVLGPDKANPDLAVGPSC